MLVGWVAGYLDNGAAYDAAAEGCMAFLHRLRPEEAHRVGLALASRGLAPVDRSQDDPILQTSVFGINFPNPVGLAAGFDKDGVAVAQLIDLGFGFVEVGSVLSDEQPGNEKPRVFRLAEDSAVINRMGFNSAGADAVMENLEATPPAGPRSSRDARLPHSPLLWATLRWEVPGGPHRHGVIGLNVGKNKWVSEEDAPDAYCRVVRNFLVHGDLMLRAPQYVVVNVSSPNTPGLRDLQRREAIRKVLQKVLHAARGNRFYRRRGYPVLVKVAPDLDEQQMRAIAAVVLELGVAGIIVSNTTVERPKSLRSQHSQEKGGLSGRPLRDMATRRVHDFHRLVQGKVPIVGVGGVASGRDAFDKILAGASLVQLYSALVYLGPRQVPRIKAELAALLHDHGFRSVGEAVGKWKEVYGTDAPPEVGED